MTHDPELYVGGFDQTLSDEEVLSRLAALRHHAASSTPILDDDDYEAALEEAADEIAGLFSCEQRTG
ncbi:MULTISPECIES: hypothetical protein [Streptomyces]|uniref:hypothetical protein n=1 Tax=Streptomyces TaxID=1883 RepID=UPI001D09C96E|nr:hypothetical protein [Streptomyces longhuiensis]UDM04838.1 hypothetical protein LGI35_44820 [Streptomyces longhuiensis]